VRGGVGRAGVAKATGVGARVAVATGEGARVEGARAGVVREEGMDIDRNIAREHSSMS
jgi:hypothetical protein